LQHFSFLSWKVSQGVQETAQSAQGQVDEGVAKGRLLDLNKPYWSRELQARGKDLAVDPVFELERQRDEPTKYSRELWTQTVEAMKEIATIAHKRQSHHIKQRLKKGMLQRRKADAVTVKKHMALIRSPAANMLSKGEWGASML
jgi:hypothetical protein